MSDIPDWAYQRAAELTNKGGVLTYTTDEIKTWATGRALAKYISEKEQPPVDPDLLLARKACLPFFGDGYQSKLLEGGYDSNLSVAAALAAIKRYKESLK